jgi:hypothetical protein
VGIDDDAHGCVYREMTQQSVVREPVL